MKDGSAALVSVIIPVYNVEKYIERAMTSVLSQTYTNFEVILSDDGSTDGSKMLCDKYADTDSRVKVIHKQNGGVSSARNAGLEIAQGDYIYFMDPDDAIDPDLLWDNVALAEQNGSDEVIFGFVSELCDDNDTCIKRISFIPELSGKYDYEAFKRSYMSYLVSVPNSVCTRLYRRSVLEGVRFVGICTAEDAIFNMDIFDRGFSSVCFNKKVYYTYYGRSGSLMNSYNPERFANENMVTDRISKTVDNWGVASEYDRYIAYRYIETMLNEYGNLSLPTCTLTDREKRRRIKTLFSDSRVKAAASKVKLSEIPYFCSRACFFLCKHKAYGVAYCFRKMYIPVSRLINRFITQFKGRSML